MRSLFPDLNDDEYELIRFTTIRNFEKNGIEPILWVSD